ncbi:MAG: hypothetical protein KKC55_17345 [Gammaproteobacteria bacterium]|nr:hypothetical protein [Gammaproteobacteria bacterium]
MRLENKKIEEELVEKKIEKRNGEFCVIHCHGADAGKVIKCYPGTKDGYKKALKMHYAIMANKYKEAPPNDLLFLIKYSILNGLDNEAIRYLEELGERKERGETDISIHFKSANSIIYQHWKRIKQKLNNKTLAILILEPYKYEKLKDTLTYLKSVKSGYHSTAKPAYRGELPSLFEDIKHLKWNERPILIDIKADGLRLSLNKIGNECTAFVDPQDLKKKSPNVSNRLETIIKEFNDIVPNNTIVDAELYVAVNGIAQHRTVINSILNTNIEASKFQNYIFAFVFDMLYYNGKDLRNASLEERLHYLSKIKNSEHIRMETVSESQSPGFQGYILDNINEDNLERVLNLIFNNKHGIHKNLQEGIMIKTLNHNYETPQNKGWMKAKQLYEIDVVAYDKSLVKGQTSVWNYDLGINVDKNYYDKLPSKIKIELDGYYFIKYGRSDNTKLNLKPSPTSILRVASEEINKYENIDYKDAPWYRGYINVAMQEVSEKSRSDSLNVFDKLATFQPRRLSVAELARLKHLQKYKSVIDLANNIEDYSDLKLILLGSKLKLERSKWKIPYKPEKLSDNQLHDDWKLLVIIQSKLKEDEKIRIDEESDEYFTEEKLINLGTQLLKEIANRKLINKVEFTVLRNNSESCNKLWNLIKQNLTDEEVEILIK